MDLYIYYKVACTHAAALQVAVGNMQAALAEAHGVACELNRRPHEQDGWHTWMEVYRAVPAGFEAALNQALQGFSLADLIDGTRHAEYFRDISSCA